MKQTSNRALFRAQKIERCIERSRKSSLKAQSPGVGLTSESKSLPVLMELSYRIRCCIDFGGLHTRRSVLFFCFIYLPASAQLFPRDIRGNAVEVGPRQANCHPDLAITSWPFLSKNHPKMSSTYRCDRLAPPAHILLCIQGKLCKARDRLPVARQSGQDRARVGETHVQNVYKTCPCRGNPSRVSLRRLHILTREHRCGTIERVHVSGASSRCPATVGGERTCLFKLIARAGD